MGLMGGTVASSSTFNGLCKGAETKMGRGDQDRGRARVTGMLGLLEMVLM